MICEFRVSAFGIRIKDWDLELGLRCRIGTRIGFADWDWRFVLGIEIGDQDWVLVDIWD